MTETGAVQPEGPVQTGVASVDEVVVAVDALAGRPLEEHVAVFEDAHERLRGALDVQPPVQPGAPRPGADG
ncbi:hypothetical protein [Nocardioides ochotonae]|uniref:hypothetical protein n=1 Tax=Nocardioides ochotonae TaxID=2685869 RepID=UPI0014087440|nr:hypothetical protein [Nocardioides ochotonae]